MIARDLGLEHREAFVALGHRQRHFFPHRIVRLPKGGVDGLKLARRMCGDDVEPGQLRQLLLHALPPVLDEFPAELFADDDLVWHRQQFGLLGHVATASLVLDGADVRVPTLLADVVQRIGRRREHKTRIENRFAGWPRLLVHAALDLAMDLGARRVLVADAGLAHEHTDAARHVERTLFDHVYDHGVGPPFHAVHEGRWWVLDVRANAASVLRPKLVDVLRPSPPRVFICHDIERGWGHVNEDAAFAARADRDAAAHLERMLEAEAAAGARATYSIVGILHHDLAAPVRERDHALAFHSFDHADADEPGADAQLGPCREVDYRVKGYRPAQSRLGPEPTDANLAFHNFEWLAGARHSLGRDGVELRNGIVRIPILFDDFDLHRGADYPTWAAGGLARLQEAIDEGRPAVFSLHDCYGEAWLPSYPALLDAVARLGAPGTLDDLAAAILLDAAS